MLLLTKVKAIIKSGSEYLGREMSVDLQTLCSTHNRKIGQSGPVLTFSLGTLHFLDNEF